MSTQIINNEKNVVTIEFKIEKDNFQKALKQSYDKNKKYFTIQGFRKGKAPRKLIEAHYGKEVFYDDAVEFAFPAAYESSIESLELTPVTRPVLEDITEIGEAGATLKVKVGIKPEVTLGDYKGAEIESLEPEVSEEDVNAEIEKIQEQNARLITDDEASLKEKDTAVIDYEGFVDDVAFEGGAGENYALVLGSKTFIPGFEEQLIGHKKGDSVDVKVTFPEAYHAEDLKGKEALFKVSVKEVKVKELPELDDEFAKDVSEFDTLDELKADTKEKLLETKTKERRAQAERKVLEFATENAELEVPSLLVDEEVARTIQNYEQQLGSQGMDLDNYLQLIGSNRTAFADSMKGDIETRIKNEYVFDAVIQAENIEVTEEETEKEIERQAAAYNQKVEDFKKVMQGEMLDYVRMDVKRKKAMELLIAAAKVS